jgi:DNA-directed RNA polymerase specialized sigma24 family protein
MDTKSIAAFVLANVAYIAATLRIIGRRHGVQFTDTDIEDMIADTQVKFLGAPVRMESERETRTYLGRIAANVATYFLRDIVPTVGVNLTDKRVSESEDDDSVSVGLTLASGAPDPEAILGAKEALADMTAWAQENLSAKDLALFRAMMESGEDFDAQEYARQTGEAPGTVRVRKSRLLATMREALAA